MNRVSGKFVSSGEKSRFNNLHKQHVNCAGDCNGNNDQQPVDQMTDENSWRTGRRVVELGYLATSMFCDCCTKHLHLSDITAEKKFGLSSILAIRCRFCGFVSSVATGKRHKTADNGKHRCFDVNTKLAAAMIHAGIGESQMTSILSVLNIPAPSATTLKMREREIGPTIEKTAETSCNKAIEEERENLDPSGDAKVIVDGGWQKRGSGHSHNSLSGHVTVIGSKTKKCLEYGVAKKKCRKCTANEGKVCKHDCRKNFTGSSKAMESFLSVKSLKNLSDKGLNVKTIIMDDDSTTICKLKKHISSDINKVSDTNHVSKNFSKEVQALQESHKSLTPKVIDYFKKCFNYAVSQNRGNPTGVATHLAAIVPHAYGDHDACADMHWCNYSSDKDYCHKSLPYGKDLSDPKLRTDLDKIILKYSSDEMLTKLSLMESSNSVENMNNNIARKAPKALHFSESESLDFRVSAAVLQKNEGHAYICKVNKNHGLSPGKTTASVLNKRDKKRSNHMLVETSTDGKKRRLQLKLKGKRTTLFHEAIEGITYKSGIHTIMTVSDDDSVTKEIPTPILCPGPPTIGAQKGSVIILFDLETTGLAYSSDILQIAAVDISSEKTFSAYVTPTNGFIPDNVRRLTDIELHGSEMYHHGLPVHSVPISVALNDFVNFLRPLGPVTLVAHNVLFDAKVLMYSDMNHGSNEICNIINGFGNTLQLFKEEFVDRKEKKLSFAQDKLAKDILGLSYHAHDAVEDVHILKRLILTVEHIYEKIPVYHVNNIKDRLTRIQNLKNYNITYQTAVTKQVLSLSKAKLLASAGLNFDHLKTVYARSGESGVNDILKLIMKSSEKVSAALCKYMDSG